METKDDRKNFTTRDGFIFNLPIDYDLDESNGDLFGIIEIPYDIFNDKESVGGTGRGQRRGQRRGPGRGQRRGPGRGNQAAQNAHPDVPNFPSERLPRISGLSGDVLAGLLRTLINGVLGSGSMNQQVVANTGYTGVNRQAIIDSIQRLLPELPNIGIIINTNNNGLYINFHSQNNNLFPAFHLSVHHTWYQMTRSSTYDGSPIHTTLEHTSNITTPPEEQSLIRVQQVLSITHRLADRNVGGLRSMRFTMGRYDGAPSLENVDDNVQRITDATIIALNENLFNQILYQETPGDWNTATLTAPQQEALNVLDDNEENFPSLGSLGGQAKHKYKKTKRKTKKKTKNLKKKSKKQKLKTKNA